MKKVLSFVRFNYPAGLQIVGKDDEENLASYHWTFDKP